MGLYPGQLWDAFDLCMGNAWPIVIQWTRSCFWFGPVVSSCFGSGQWFDVLGQLVRFGAGQWFGVLGQLVRFGAGQWFDSW